MTAANSVHADTVYLIDVDNTLYDNDRFAVDLTAELERNFGESGRAEYWAIYERLRDTLGYADYLGALQQFRHGRDDRPELLALSTWLLDYPFDRHLLPGALAVAAHLRSLGHAVILSDGDAVFQVRKVRRSGLWEAFDGQVLILLHKERELSAVQRRYPAAHYVMIDDKPNLLAAMKRELGDRLTSVFVRQGHYAQQADMASIDPPPDRTIERIDALLACDAGAFRLGGRSGQAAASADRYR